MSRKAVIASLFAGVIVLSGAAACSDSPEGQPDSTAAQPGAVERVAVDLPPEFPPDFPLLEGKVVEVASVGATGWSATVQAKTEKELNSALKRLKDQGYSVHGENTGESGDQSYALNNGTMSVSLVLVQSDSEFLAKYSFAPMNS